MLSHCTIIVAVCVPCSPPPQHSPIFGQRASSHTVANFRSRSCSLILLKLAPIGISFFSHGGRRKRFSSPLSRFSLPWYAHCCCCCSAAVNSGSWTKSWNDGPFAKRSRIFSNLLGLEQCYNAMNELKSVKIVCCSYQNCKSDFIIAYPNQIQLTRR